MIKANIHSFLESDDRVNIVVKFLDEAIGQLDNMDSLVSSYKIHLNVGTTLIHLETLLIFSLCRPSVMTYYIFSLKTGVYKCRPRINRRF